MNTLSVWQLINQIIRTEDTPRLAYFAKSSRRTFQHQKFKLVYIAAGAKSENNKEVILHRSTTPPSFLHFSHNSLARPNQHAECFASHCQATFPHSNRVLCHIEEISKGAWWLGFKCIRTCAAHAFPIATMCTALCI